jgi:hypothetical protein
VLLALLAGCDRRQAVTSCDDNLRGVWVTETGARWSLLDQGATLEAFPLFDDALPAAGGAPRVIDLARTDKLAGEVQRRFTHGPHHCVAKAPIRVAKCEAGSLQVVSTDPQPPLQFSPCAWGRPVESRVDRWLQE